MRAVVIGPGRIGCGFVGQLLRSSGWDVTFIGREPVADHLRRHQRYVVRLVDGHGTEDIVVAGVTALSVADVTASAGAIATADLIATAVGPASLAAIAQVIAAGLLRRSTPVNVIAFENLVRAGAHLRQLVGRYLPAGYPLDAHGFSGAVVSRVVSQRLCPTRPGEALLVIGDRPSSFSVERAALRDPLPAVAGMTATDDYEAHVARKLYSYSAGHAACAYLGFLKGYRYIHSAIRDPEIRTAVRAAMDEGRRGLAARYGPGLAGTEAELDAMLERFANAGLGDLILRVGRDPCRKLSADDRLVGAARLAASSGLPPEKLALAVAAALVFCDPADPSCLALHREVEARGIASVLRDVCGIGADEALGKLVADEFASLAGWAHGNSLLSLEHRLWAWTAPSDVAA